MDAPPTRRGRTRAVWPVVAVVALFLLASVPLILSGAMVGRSAWDQVNYHEKVVRTFIAEWPKPDLSNYLSATTPLYHLILAAVGKYVSDSRVVLQLTGSLFTVGLLATMAIGLARTTTALRVFVFTMVLATSLYVFPAGVWLLPDNLAWWGVLAVLLLAWRCRFDAAMVVGGGAVMALLVLARQSHVWAAAALWAGAWMSLDAKRQAMPHQKWRSPLGTAESRRSSEVAEFAEGAEKKGSGEGQVTRGGRADGVARGTLAQIFTEPTRRASRAAVMVLATLPAFAIVAAFRHHWGGRLYPPVFDVQLKFPPNPATPVFILAVFGAINLFFVAYLWPRLAVLWRQARGLTIALALAAIAIASIPETTWSIEAGRYGGLWKLAQVGPLVMGRSPLIVGLAAWGAMALLGWCAALSRGPRVVVVVALMGFIASQAIAHLSYQRYYEPMMLMVTLLLAARTPEWPGPRWLHPFKLLGPAALALGLAAVTSMSLRHSGEVRDEGTTKEWVPGAAGA